ncbi:MAG: CRISPR-associated protein Csx11 [Candidatus Magnetoovum sp. WYHC-5]|nr:CRISPR-associated protein Csx11 [Candidatus Magnetoovum sp. WYHC-5]
MAGKAKIDFLQNHGGQKNNYDYNNWCVVGSISFVFDDLLKCVKDKYPTQKNTINSFQEFIIKHHKIKHHKIKHHKNDGKGMLGLLQAGHAMASGIEKNLPTDASKYLGQDTTHMWLSSSFGYPVKNILIDKPDILTDVGWKELLDEINRILCELRYLGHNDINDIDGWWQWRESAIGLDNLLHKAFSSTLAETRLPNNDVTLWDQSYIAASLFKSAVAGAIMEEKNFDWEKTDLKTKTRWRLLTVGIGTEHYETRAVKIGDWLGTQLVLNEFFCKVRKLIEVDLAVGSLLYADATVSVFSFPSELKGDLKPSELKGDLKIKEWQQWLNEQVESYVKDANLETPPYCCISEPSRALVKITEEIQKAREAMKVPLHQDWQITNNDESNGHICPVCLVRRNNNDKDKQKPCNICQKRRIQRLDHWLSGTAKSDSIWISEIADVNDRVALVTMSLDIEPWLNGNRLDALRTQAIPEWLLFNSSILKPHIDSNRPFESLVDYIKKVCGVDLNKYDTVLKKLQDGYKYESDWPTFFKKIVEDRAKAPIWDTTNHIKNARWLTHQLLRKLASPGRIYRFQRQAEEFFTTLLNKFRGLASSNPNHWRTKRLILKGAQQQWEDRQTYSGYYGDAPINLLYQQHSDDFLTICNIGRLLERTQDRNTLKDKTINLKSDDGQNKILKINEVGDAGKLGVYYPVIPLELNPMRFRVLLPLESTSACIDLAIAKWEEEFSRVWDRLPLRIGIVAFPRMMPFQAVIEAARNIEHELDTTDTYEVWQVNGHEVQDGVAAINFNCPDGQHELKTMPIKLADGREDVFYPYLSVEDKQVRFPHDFQHPDGQVYRHARDLRCCDSVHVYPATMATVFMDCAARRLEPVKKRGLMQWRKMQNIWKILEKIVPTQTALRGSWSELTQLSENWKKPDGKWTDDGKKAWLDLVRAVLHERLGARGACLDILVEAAADGTLKWAIEWHISVLKQQIKENNNSCQPIQI